MIGEIAFREEQDKVEMLAKIVAALHWAAPIVARGCRTSRKNIGFFGPRKVLHNGQTLLIYRLAPVYGTDEETLRESVWRRNAVFLDPKVADNNEQRRWNAKKAPSSSLGDVACLG